jgi:N-carbamoylputrescine amidase
MNDLRVAAVVMRSVLGKVEDNLNRMKTWVDKAASEKAGLVCFPELNLTGYTVRKRIRSVAEPIPGPLSQEVVKMARESGMVILAGLVERDQEGRIFACQLVASPEGLQGAYRKCHLSPFEQSLYSAGDAVPVFDVKGNTFGIQLCYDTHFPELSTLLALKGVNILFCPHASPRGTSEQKQQSWLRHLTARAYDNGVFVVACNQTGDNEGGLEFPGLALILNPSAEVIGGYVGGDEAILFADLKATEFAHVRKNTMRFFLPNRRPDLYEGLIKRNPIR